jgi:hypothetical protein
MKNKLLLLFLIIVLLYGCKSSDEEDCTKIITIPRFYIVNNQSYRYDTTQEVPCNFPEPSVPELIEPPELENFTYEVLNFTFTSDTGNNTSRLQFQMKLNNPNDYSAKGVPILITNADGLESSRSFSNDASIPCFEIGANSHCILTYDQESSLDSGLINSIELIDIKYLLTD